MFKSMKNRLVAVLAVAAAALSASPAFATADIASTDVTTALTNVMPDATVIFQGVLPVLGSVVALIIALKLFKRFANKI